MQAQLACILLLFFTCGGLCTDVDQDQRALEEELLSSLFTSKITQNKQSAPYWRVSLANLCRMVGSLGRETWSGEEREDGEPRGESLQMLDELYSLQHICRVLQGREERLLHDSLEYSEQSSDTLPKRKSPYILKRQAAHTTKSRRPYILKRSTVY
ncbi:putative neurotensin/neuromedin N [Scophthalmus maximus]|uniref:Neurotensin/neuromedin N n=1 Tax=Scophthalmus maximus TaxID=52904 RepID=A0A2U9BUH6_SCOMX|nr:neurotensin/neuromedin N [Scophthalmus maximus]AWP07875.1 putative neurotensin/neuromedin N [Scophthalmus maximus]